MLYIHIPFCRSKCAYCDFLSFAPGEASLYTRCGQIVADYTRALLAEMEATRTAAAYRSAEPPTLTSVYIGGGTPTALPASFLCEIIGEARRFNLADGAEITVEANPMLTTSSGIAPAGYFSALKSAGVNRLSIGLQAFQDSLLTRIGRTHTAQDFINTFRAARDAGFDNINVDLMFSLPGQTMGDWRESLARLVDLRPEHISAYSLTPAEDTPLWDGLQAGTIALPGDETDRAMYHEANRVLAAAGYTRYEISNFALPGRESRHNVNTWKRKPYRGFGLGAHSFETTEKTVDSAKGGRRWHNTENMEKYLRAWGRAGGKASGETPPPDTYRENFETLSMDDAMSETLILGLRLAEGIIEKEFETAFGKSICAVYGTKINKPIADGLLVRNNGRLSLTPLGTDLANRVFGLFV
jgi:oxygen-independent coproporphyrinogen-3 oxidase